MAEANKDKIMLPKEQMQQQAQQQQQQAQQQAQVDQSKIAATMAKAQLDQAKVAESFAKREDLLADAEYKKVETEYGLVRSMLELENMDLDLIHRSYEIAMAIKNQNDPKNQEQPAMAG